MGCRDISRSVLSFRRQVFIIDAFNGGDILFEQDCEERLAQIYGQPVKMQPFFVEPVSRRQFLARMLSNLKMIYLDKQDLAKALLAVERIVLLLPDSLTELRDRGLLYYQLVRWLEAARNLETYLEKAPSTEDAGVIRQLLRELRKNDFNP